MGKILTKSFGGKSEFLLDKNYFTKPFHFDNTEAYVTTMPDGSKVVLAGTVVPANDNTAVGLCFEDYDVTNDSFNGAIVYAGRVKESKLPAPIAGAAKTVLPRITIE